MKIYTKSGDQGETSLFGGNRVSKGEDRIEAYGNVDELNSWIGYLKDQDINRSRSSLLEEIQNRLFDIGSSLAAAPGKKNLKIPQLQEADIHLMENAIDQMETQLEPLRNFILPGGHPAVSFCHVARCVCRRTERSVVRLHRLEKVDALVIQYLNRLSDYLFVLSRAMARELHAPEVLWKARE
jgi:cob(I)alamin adenosyltransferase